MQFSRQRILIIAPHPDDEAFGCAGLMHRCTREGGEVYVLFLTVGITHDYSKQGVSTAEERLEEIEKAMAHLNVDGYRMAFPGNDYHLRLDALPQKDLINEIERGEQISIEAVKPTMILAPHPNDYNQDHRAAAKALITATRPAPPTFRHRVPLILHYELPSTGCWTDTDGHTSPNVFVELSQEDMDAKIAALELYPSQLKDPIAPLSTNGAKTLAMMRGMHSGALYAEAFYGRRLLL